MLKLMSFLDMTYLEALDFLEEYGEAEALIRISEVQEYV